MTSCETQLVIKTAKNRTDHTVVFDLHRTIKIVIVLNLTYFCVQVSIASLIGSVSLFADATDYLEDAAINSLILIGLNWPPSRRAALGKVLAAIIFVPALAALWTLRQKFTNFTGPEPLILTLAGIGALAVNLACAFLLARHQHQGGSLTKAAFVSARNDTFANLAVICGGGLTALTHSAWPDILIGLAIAALNADAAGEVFEAARRETTGSAKDRDQSW